MKFQTPKLFAATATLIFAVVFFAVYQVGDAGRVLAQKTGARGSSDSAGLARAHPFEPSEELLYVAEFSRALLRKMDVADFRFTVHREPLLQKVTERHPVQEKGDAPYLLKLTGDVSSKGFFSKLFNLRFRERIESVVEPAPFRVTSTKKIDQQGKRERISETSYANGKVFWTERDPNNPAAGPREASAPFSGQIQDLLSAIYYLRTHPLEIGKTFEVTVSDSGRVYQVPVQVLEKKRKKTVLGRVDVIRLDPQVFGPNRLLTGDGQISIWLTNDSRRIPVSARIKTKYGSFDITLRKVIQNPAPREALANTLAN